MSDAKTVSKPIETDRFVKITELALELDTTLEYLIKRCIDGTLTPWIYHDDGERITSWLKVGTEDLAEFLYTSCSVSPTAMVKIRGIAEHAIPGVVQQDWDVVWSFGPELDIELFKIHFFSEDLNAFKNEIRDGKTDPLAPKEPPAPPLHSIDSSSEVPLVLNEKRQHGKPASNGNIGVVQEIAERIAPKKMNPRERSLYIWNGGWNLSKLAEDVENHGDIRIKHMKRKSIRNVLQTLKAENKLPFIPSETI
jgi:hypothetical protein